MIFVHVEQLIGTVPTSRPKLALLNRVTGGGLSVSYCFTRTISVLSSRSISVELSFTNLSDQPLSNLHIGNKVSAFRIRIAVVCAVSFTTCRNVTGLNTYLCWSSVSNHMYVRSPLIWFICVFLLHGAARAQLLRQ